MAAHAYHGNSCSTWQLMLNMTTHAHHGNTHLIIIATHAHHGNTCSPWQPTLTMATGMHRRHPVPRLQPEGTWSRAGMVQTESAAVWAWGSTCQQRRPSSCQTSRGQAARVASTEWWRQAGGRWHKDIGSPAPLSTLRTVPHSPVQTERERCSDLKLPTDPKDFLL